MIEILEFIVKNLDSITEKSYSADSVQENLKLPYLTYSLPGSVVGELGEDFQFIIDIWGSSKKLREIETLSKNVVKQFERLVYLDYTFLVRFYLSSRLQIPDEDSKISRRRLVFTAKTHFVNNNKGE